MEKEYISLKEATKYCPYSPDYLKLRARQGKLKAIKIARNWVTTKEWLEEYLREFSIFNHSSSIDGLGSTLLKKGGGFQFSSEKKSPLFPSVQGRTLHRLAFIFGLLMILIIFEVIINSKLVESFLKKIIPAKTIEIERNID